MHAVVTGGSRGIGLAIAQALRENGARVSVFARSNGVDVSDEASVQSAFANARAQHGRIAMLINGAGIAHAAPLKRTDRAMWDRTIAVNLSGTFLCSRLVIDEMLEAGWGRIVNVASIAGLHGAPYISAYAASKHGVIGFTRSVSAELEGSGVTMNAICPGYTDTDMMRAAISNITSRTGMNEAQARTELARMNPGGRIVSPEEVAAACMELLESERNGAEIVLPRG